MRKSVMYFLFCFCLAVTAKNLAVVVSHEPFVFPQDEFAATYFDNTIVYKEGKKLFYFDSTTQKSTTFTFDHDIMSFTFSKDMKCVEIFFVYPSWLEHKVYDVENDRFISDLTLAEDCCRKGRNITFAPNEKGDIQIGALGHDVCQEVVVLYTKDRFLKSMFFEKSASNVSFVGENKIKIVFVDKTEKIIPLGYAHGTCLSNNALDGAVFKERQWIPDEFDMRNVFGGKVNSGSAYLGLLGKNHQLQVFDNIAGKLIYKTTKPVYDFEFFQMDDKELDVSCLIRFFDGTTALVSLLDNRRFWARNVQITKTKKFLGLQLASTVLMLFDLEKRQLLQSTIFGLKKGIKEYDFLIDEKENCFYCRVLFDDNSAELIDLKKDTCVHSCKEGFGRGCKYVGAWFGSRSVFFFDVEEERLIKSTSIGNAKTEFHVAADFCDENGINRYCFVFFKNGAAQLIDIGRGEIMPALGIKSSNSKRYLSALLQDGSLMVFDCNNRTRVANMAGDTFLGSDKSVSSFTFFGTGPEKHPCGCFCKACVGPDGDFAKEILTPERFLFIEFSDKSHCMVDLKKNKTLPVSCFVLSDDKRYLAMKLADGQLIVCDSDNKTIVHVLNFKVRNFWFYKMNGNNLFLFERREKEPNRDVSHALFAYDFTKNKLLKGYCSVKSSDKKFLFLHLEDNSGLLFDLRNCRIIKIIKGIGEVAFSGTSLMIKNQFGVLKEFDLNQERFTDKKRTEIREQVSKRKRNERLGTNKRRKPNKDV